MSTITVSVGGPGLSSTGQAQGTWSLKAEIDRGRVSVCHRCQVTGLNVRLVHGQRLDRSDRSPLCTHPFFYDGWCQKNVLARQPSAKLQEVPQVRKPNVQVSSTSAPCCPHEAASAAQAAKAVRVAAVPPKPLSYWRAVCFWCIEWRSFLVGYGFPCFSSSWLQRKTENNLGRLPL